MAHQDEDAPQTERRENETYQSPTEARDAVIDLEQHGVDADRIQVESAGPAADERQRRGADSEMAKRVFGRAAVGGMIGTVIGAVVGLLVTLAIGVDPQPAAPIGALLGGGAFGGALGFFYGAASKLPVTEGALDLSGAESGEVEITVDPK